MSSNTAMTKGSSTSTRFTRKELPKTTLRQSQRANAVTVSAPRSCKTAEFEFPTY